MLPPMLQRALPLTLRYVITMLIRQQAAATGNSTQARRFDDDAAFTPCRLFR